MKSVKPGRGPSGLGAIGSIIGVLFGIFWTINAVQMGAPAAFAAFGVLFVIVGIVNAVYNYKNATGKNRYSSFDITDEGEETDPLQARFGGQSSGEGNTAISAAAYCPYCGCGVDGDYEYCPKCGKKLPK